MGKRVCLTALVLVSSLSACSLWQDDADASVTRRGDRKRSPLPCQDSADPLVRTAMAGTAPAVRKLLAEGADPDAGDAQGRFALSCAAFSGNVDVVTVLLAAGADPDTHSDEGGTPVEAAVLGGSSLTDEDEVLTKGVAPTDSKARLDIVTLLAEAEATLDPGVATAARIDSVAALERLLRLGADPNGDASERSPLLEVAHGLFSSSACAEQQDCEVLDLLLAAGADPDDGGTTSSTELVWGLALISDEQSDPSAWSKTVDRIEEQLPPAGNVPPVAAAALSSNHPALQRLLRAGADPNALAFDVIPPLWAAAVVGDEAGVLMLLGAGADPTPAVPSWVRPLDAATARGHATIEELIANAGG